MKRSFTLALSLILLILLSKWGLAQGVVTMPNTDGGQKTVAVTETQPFFDAGGETGSIPNYQITRITFSAPAGKVVQVMFESTDLQGGSLIKVFDGVKALNEYYDELEDETTYSIPTGHKQVISGTQSNITVKSEATDGSLTICFQNSNGSGAGWKATVTLDDGIALPDNEVRIAATPNTKEVGSTPLNFYDNGGKDGKITKDFNGQITFTPQTPGNRVKIDFTKVAIFYNSSAASVGNQDVLKIYSGTTVNEENLIETLTTNPAIVKSRATDGSLTVTLKSKTGYPADGFEALVTQYTPQNMTYQSAEQVQYTQGTVAAGDKEQAIVAVNVKTENQLNPLTVSKLTFTTGGTFAQINKATIFYTNRSNSFSTLVKVGETTINADAFEITLPVPQALNEGDNYFWLAYDIKPEAQNGLGIDGSCSEITLSTGSQTISPSNPEGSRTIKNEYVSTIGTFERTVYGTWTYTHTPNPYGSGYKAEIGDQIITFKPGTPGKIIEINFADFDVYYSNTSYGTKAKFAIYSGQGTGGEMLWELTNADDKSIGPNMTLRSKSEDGAITVVFNANTSSSYSNGKGWHATIAEYQPKPMEFKGVIATQNNTGIIKPGATNQEIIGIEISTEGNLTPLTLNEVCINLKGSHSHVKKVTLFTTGSNNTFAPSTPIATKETPGATETLLLETPLALTEGKNYLWVAYDMADELEAELAIDASLTSIRIGSGNHTPTTGDPNGARLTKNIYLFEGGSKTVKVNNSLLFYDNGGSENNYSNSIKGTVTFIPKEGQVIKFIFKQFNTRYNDYFYVYNGSTTDNQLAKLSGSKLPEPLLSSASDGSLTVKFEPKSTYNAGWAIEVQSYTPKPLTVSSIKSIAATSKSLLRGAQNEAMLRVDVSVEGDNGTINLTELSIDPQNTTSGSDIASANVFFTDTISTFNVNTQYANSTTSAPFKFTGNTSITKAGVYKFWVAYNVSANTAIGNKLQARLNTVRIADNPADITENTTASRTVKAGFNGTYTIGNSSTAHYPTIAKAVEAMVNGIDGKVVFQIENGTYNELVTIPHIEGASAENTITLKSINSDYNTVAIEVNTYSAPAYGEEKNGLFTVKGADYLTLDGVTIKTNKTAFPAVIQVKNISSHVTVKNCLIQAPRSTSYSSGDIKLISVEGGNTAFTNSDFFTLQNCVVDGGYTGANINGTGYVALPKQKGCQILNNTFCNQGSISVYMTKEHDGLVDGNIITNNGTTASTYKAIDAVCIGNTIIRNNRINASTSNATNGIYLRKRDDNETLGGRNQIYNNEIIIASSGNSDIHGIYLTDPISSCDIAHNSVNIVKTNSEKSSGIYMVGSSAPSNCNVTNNLLQNNADGYTYYINKTELLAGLSFSNNGLYTSSKSKFAYAGGEKENLEAWVEASKETNSLVEKAEFVSESSLDINIVGKLNAGTPLRFVTTDINGNARSTSTPTMGAYEFAETTIPTMANGFPQFASITHNSVIVKIKSTEHGKGFIVLKESNATAPEADEILASPPINLTKNVKTSVCVDNLKNETEYTAYIILQNTNGQNSSIIASSPVKTGIIPTQVSTFENVTPTGETFTDGTASFVGFTILEITDGQGPNNKKAAQISSSPATISITNSTEGLMLNGFYLKTDAEVTLTAKQNGDVKGTKNLTATNGKWVFINLKDMEEITTVTLSGLGNVLIDNFSGEPQPITFMLEDKTAIEGDKFTIESDIYGGVLPYSYQWINSKQEIVSTLANLELIASHTARYTLTVTDAWGNSSQSSSLITVQGKAAAATFDDLYLAPESRWWGDPENMTSTFHSGSYSFSNTLVESMSTWAGFGYSNKTTTTFENYMKDQFNSAVGHGANNSANYAVVYTTGDPTKITITNNENGSNISGFYITNNAWVKWVSEHGTGVESTDDPTSKAPFKQGDWYKVIATADNGNTLEFYLADYRAENPADHYTLDTWEWFDLSELGQVKWVKFSANGTRRNTYGTTIPLYFCIDDFGGKRNDQLVATVLVKPSEEKTININQWLNLDEQASTNYQVVTSCVNGIASADINAEHLIIKGLTLGTDTMIISATQKGRTAYIKVPIKVANTHILTYTAGEGGSISGITPQTVEQGGHGTEVEAVPSADYKFVKWSDNVTTAKRTDTNVASNISVTAQFEINTGVDDNNANNISVYPNPFSNNLYIKNAEDVTLVRITNIMGQVMLNSQNDGNDKICIETGMLKPGIYLITIYTDNSKLVRKIVKE